MAAEWRPQRQRAPLMAHSGRRSNGATGHGGNFRNPLWSVGLAHFFYDRCRTFLSDVRQMSGLCLPSRALV
jgi:hypothetical protein